MAVTGCVFVCGKACDYRYGERKIKMLSAKFDGEGNKKAKKIYIYQKGKEKRHKTRSLSLCCASVTKLRATPRPASLMAIEGLMALKS